MLWSAIFQENVVISVSKCTAFVDLYCLPGNVSFVYQIFVLLVNDFSVKICFDLVILTLVW